MRVEQIEAWVLSIVDAVEGGRKIEDSRVELKASWPDAPKAARRIAAHANASHGDLVMWIIGLDESRGVTYCPDVELANWWDAVKAQFDGIEPAVTDVRVPTRNGLVTALLFNTSRRPFVVKNPAFEATPDAVALEVPWRDGTKTRSARREDLIRLLAPSQALPDVELLTAHVSCERKSQSHGNPIETSEYLVWTGKLSLYVTPRTSEQVVWPRHKAILMFRAPDTETWVTTSPIFALDPFLQHGGTETTDSYTMLVTGSEAIIKGPGTLHLNFGHSEQSGRLPPDEALSMKFSAIAAGGDRSVDVAQSLRLFNSKEQSRLWRFEAALERI